MLTARGVLPSAGMVTVWVKVAWGKEGCLEGDRSVTSCEKLADEDETVVEATHVAKQIPDIVAGPLLNDDIVRQDQLDTSRFSKIVSLTLLRHCKVRDILLALEGTVDIVGELEAVHSQIELMIQFFLVDKGVSKSCLERSDRVLWVKDVVQIEHFQSSRLCEGNLIP